MGLQSEFVVCGAVPGRAGKRPLSLESIEIEDITELCQGGDSKILSG